MIAFKGYFAERLKSPRLRTISNAELQKISTTYKLGKFLEAEQMLTDLISILTDRRLWEFEA